MVADFLVIFLVGASHLAAAASVPGRKLVDLEMSLLVAAGLEIDDRFAILMGRSGVLMMTKCRPPYAWLAQPSHDIRVAIILCN
jgi:hypothetical protein